MTRSRTRIVLAALVLALALPAQAAGTTTTVFSGAKVNAGTVTYTVEGGQRMLTLSPDFVVPDTPDPHWQVVDSKGMAHLLSRLAIKGDKVNRSVVLPDHVKDVAKVQIYCAWAEAVLGEASFPLAVK